MAMANKDGKVRYVRCPKCHKLLIEFADVPVYKCGGCDTTLKAKYYNATKGNGTIGSLEINQFNNICNGSSDSGTASLGKEISSCSDAQSSEVDPGREHDTLSNLSSSFSSAEYNCHQRGESTETGEDRVKENSNNDQLVSRMKTEGTSERNPDEHILTEAEDCLDVEAEKSPKLSTLVSDSLMLSVKLEESTEYSVTGEYGIKEDFNTSQSAFRDDTGDTSKNQPDESIQDETEHRLNEEADKSLKQSQQVSLDDKLAESPESVTQDVISEEDLVDRIHGGWDGQYLRSPSRSSEAYHGSVSSSEIRSNDCFQKETVGVGLESNKMDTYLVPKLQDLTLKLSNEREMSSFGSNRDESSSSRYNILKQERGTSLDSADFYSVQNWMESEGPSRTASRGSTFHGDSFDCENGSASTKFKHLGKDSLELLKKVDELRHRLGELNDAKEGRRGFQVKRNTNQQPSFFNKSGKQYSQCLNSNSARRPPGSYSRMRTSMPQYYQFSQMPLSGQTCCSCLHCVEDHHMQFLPNFGHNVPFRTCDYNMRSHHSKAMNPHLHIGSNVPPCYPKVQTHGMELEKPHYKEKKQTAKRHCRPLSGGAPFVICYNCLKLLQLPADFFISRRRLQKLQCGACSKVLFLSFPSSGHTTPRIPIKAFHPPSEVGSNSYAPAHQIYLSHPNNCPEDDPISLSEEYGISFAQSSTNSSENINGRRAPVLTLHRLMGYSSATEILYQPSDNDEGYESADPMRPHSYIPSEESHVSID